MQERSDNSHFFFRSVWRRSERGVFSLSLLFHIHLCRWDGPFWGLKCVIHKWRPNLSGSPEMWPPVAGDVAAGRRNLADFDWWCGKENLT